MLYKLYEMMVNDKEDIFKKYLEKCCQGRQLFDIITAPLDDNSTLLYHAVVFDKLWTIEHIFNHLDKLEQKKILNIVYDVTDTDNQDLQRNSLKEIALLTSPDRIYPYLKEKEIWLSKEIESMSSGEESRKNLEAFTNKKKSLSKIEFSPPLQISDTELASTHAKTLLPMIINDKRERFKKFLAEYSNNSDLFSIFIVPLKHGQSLLYRTIFLGKKWVIEYLFSQLDPLGQKKIINTLFEVPNHPMQLSSIGLAHFACQFEIADFLTQKANFLFGTRSAEHSMNNLETVLKTARKTADILSFLAIEPPKTIQPSLPARSFSPTTRSHNQKKRSSEKNLEEEFSEWFKTDIYMTPRKSRGKS